MKRRKNENRLSMGELKRLARRRLPKDSALRDVLLAEKERITVEEFLAKAPIWLRLVKQED